MNKFYPVIYTPKEDHELKGYCVVPPDVWHSNEKAVFVDPLTDIYAFTKEGLVDFICCHCRGANRVDTERVIDIKFHGFPGKINKPS